MESERDPTEAGCIHFGPPKQLSEAINKKDDWEQSVSADGETFTHFSQGKLWEVPVQLGRMAPLPLIVGLGFLFQFLAAGRLGELQIDFVEGHVKRAAERFRFCLKGRFDTVGQSPAVLAAQVEFPPGIGILVAAATGHEESHRAGMALLEILLSEAGIIATELVETERCRMAGIAEQHGFQVIFTRRDLEHGNVVINRAVRIGVITGAVFRRRPPVHREARRAHRLLEVYEEFILANRAAQLCWIAYDYGQFPRICRYGG